MQTVKDTTDNKALIFVKNENVKTLRLQWEPQMDLLL